MEVKKTQNTVANSKASTTSTPSGIDVALSHITSTSSIDGGQITQALQSIASHNSQGEPLTKAMLSFTARKPTPLLPHPGKNLVGGAPASDPPPSAPPSSGGDLGTLIGMLNDATKGPAAAKDSGTAPPPTQVGVIAPYNDASIMTNYQYLIDMASMIQLYTCIYDLNMQKQRGAKNPNGITDAAEAAQAFADQANAAFEAITGPLAGLYDITSQTSVNYSKSMRKTEIHLEFLGQLFKGFSLGQAALDQLDSVLTNFVSAISDLNITSSSENNSIDQTVLIHQVARTNISGDDSNPIYVYEPKTRLIYMKIDSQSWFWATNKASDSGFTFQMHNVVVDATLNVEKFLSTKDKLDQIFVYLVDQNLQQYGTNITGTPVKSNS